GPSPAETLMELLVIVDALHRSSAGRITAVVPYFGYSRQDRRSRLTRVPITAKLVAKMIEAAGVNRILTMDLHADQIQGFFDIPVDNLHISPIFAPDVEKRFKGEKLVMVSPDVGGVVRARAFAKKVDADLAIIDKRREKAGVSEVMNVIGDVKDKVCIMVDDIVDSGGTLCNAAAALKANGAKEVYSYVVHGVLSGGAVARISSSEIEKLVIGDTIAATEAVRVSESIEQLSVAELMGEAIKRISEEKSISELFN
ncbi:MAG TPA: ribose-phosphate pyrophosphokinase, partial [Micavibrio sp.]|nr:ribose-phosphate pyrophosphokinase [Micavibrio sp.]